MSNIHLISTCIKYLVLPLTDTYNDPEWGPTDKKPHLAIQYANGPGYYKHRQDINNRTVPRWNLTGVDTG